VPSDRLLVSQPDRSLPAAGLDETRHRSRTDSTGAGVPGLATACLNSVNTARPVTDLCDICKAFHEAKVTRKR